MYALIKNNTVHGHIETDAQTAAEITAAGEYLAVECAGVPENDSTYDPETGVITPPSPPAPPAAARILTKVAYLKRFTQAERMAIRGAAKESPQVEDYVELLNLSEEVDLDDPETVLGVNTLEAAGLIGAGRAAEILA